EQLSILIEGVLSSSVAWGDYDNDNDLDLILSGSDADYIGTSKIYKNINNVSNTIPNSPANIQTTVIGNRVTLSWDRSSDNETPPKGLNYNIYIDTISEGSGINSPMSDISDGTRRIAQKGFIQDSMCIINKLDSGKYYWSVQAIDHSFAGSAFAIEDSFDVTFTNSIAPVDSQILSPGSSGTELGVIETGSADSWQWKYSLNPGGPYEYEITGETGNDYTPSFDVCGIYHVVCVSTMGGVSVTSNEIVIEVTYFEETEIVITGVNLSSIVCGDYNNNDSLDILLTGYASVSGIISKIYNNDGTGTFTDLSGTGLTKINRGSVDWGDYDNDGDLDILYTGYTGSAKISYIYRNNGDSTFTEVPNISLEGVEYGSAAWGDYDNDGDLDILLTGNSSLGRISKIYRNDNDTVFTDQTIVTLYGVEYSSVAWGDYDNDGYIDILLTGESNTGEISKIYKNNGDYTFTEQTGISLEGVDYGSVAWGDYDNDGYLDIILTGWNSSNVKVTKIYKNNGDDSFTEQTNISLTGVAYGSAAWGDYNNDGYLDIIISGSSAEGYITIIYKNNGNNTFTEQTGISLKQVIMGSVAWGDYDNDGDLDILVTGRDDDNNYFSLI
ncbi:FG-GAP repeat domain-containing protein, partial [Bacteroidota bacterium]